MKCEREGRRRFEKGNMVCERVQAREGGKMWGKRVEKKVKKEWKCLEFRVSEC